MYVTRLLSHYRHNPESLSIPPQGPNSGYLVIQDEESEIYSCFGLCKNRAGEHRHTSYHDATFVPVLNQPLSSKRYYVIEPHGKRKGMAYACSKEEDMTTCCFCRCVKDVKPRPFDPLEIYQQFEIANCDSACSQRGTFYTKSVTHDAFPPGFLRTKGWQISTKTPKNYTLGEALGIDSALRAHLPSLNFPLSHKSSKAVTPRDQMENSMFYEMTLEQRWEKIFECDYTDQGNVVMVDAVVPRESVLVGGREAVWNKKNVVDNAIWFKSFGSQGEEVSVGLSLEIVERMKWEEERVGWAGGDEREVRVNRVEEFRGDAEGWKKFGCYVLVESFVLKRMDGSVVMTYDFKHTHQIKCMWE
ncbi:hypothetical protein DCAR_0727205 [Daucus carota subsp. sativus]|uniref:Uncharacterized protein n=1 Tax=Daucus carota subsp. sativus TaxID=79200 RepID=A0AAF0XJV1_DAUCS|nr:hypothetical protein DCAR_0727205 [Daucus carota subsp. sativus]